MVAGALLGSRQPVVEIIGPAGAGKTTLVRALRERCDRVQPGLRINRIRYLQFLLGIGVLFLPVFVLRYPRSRWFTWREIRSMVYLKGWHHILGKRSAQADAVTVMDHGPIFRLVILREFGPEITRSRVYRRWWESVLQQWIATLDSIVWLDAPNEILLERVRDRNVPHALKKKAAEEAQEFLHRYRKCFEYVVTRITESGGPQPQCFDTREMSTVQIADAVLAEVNCEIRQSSNRVATVNRGPVSIE